MCVHHCHPTGGKSLAVILDSARTHCLGHRPTHVAAVRCSRLATNLREDQVKPCRSHGCGHCPRRERVVVPPARGNDPFAADAHQPRLPQLPPVPPAPGQGIDVVA